MTRTIPLEGPRWPAGRTAKVERQLCGRFGPPGRFSCDAARPEAVGHERLLSGPPGAMTKSSNGLATPPPGQLDQMGIDHRRAHIAVSAATTNGWCTVPRTGRLTPFQRNRLM